MALHTSDTLGPVDIYMGGSDNEHLALSALEYTQLSEYQEVSDQRIWTSVLVTPAYTLPADSIILEYYANSYFQSGGVYLCVLEHENSSSESPFQIQPFNQPVYQLTE